MSDNVPICTINVVVNYLKRKFSRDRYLDNYESKDCFTDPLIYLCFRTQGI